MTAKNMGRAAPTPPLKSASDYFPFYNRFLMSIFFNLLVSWYGNKFCLAWYFMKQQQLTAINTLTAINNAMVINKKTSKIYNFFCFTGYLFFVKSWRTFCWNVFFFSSFCDLARVGEVSDCKVSDRFASTISSHVITESLIILPAYLPFSQQLVEGFQI